MDFMEKEMEKRMKRFLFKRAYDSVLSKKDETLSLLDEVIDYGVEKIIEENPLFAVLFPLKLCAMDKDDLGLMLAGEAVVHPVDGDRIIYPSGSEILEKMFNISGGIMSVYADGIVPKDLKTKIKFKGVGGANLYGSSPEMTDLILCHGEWATNGFEGCTSLADGKVSYVLGPANRADYEVSGPSTSMRHFVFGAVDSSNLNDGIREYVEYMEKVFSKIADTILDKYPEYVLLTEKWFKSRVDEWNSDKEKMDKLKAVDGTMLLNINNINGSDIFPDGVMERVLGSLDPTVKKGIDEDGKATVLIQWKDGVIDLRWLKPGEEVLHSATATMNYELISRMAGGEALVMHAYKMGDLKLTGKGAVILPVFDGLIELFHHLFDGHVAGIVKKNIKGL